MENGAYCAFYGRPRNDRGQPAAGRTGAPMIRLLNPRAQRTVSLVRTGRIAQVGNSRLLGLNASWNSTTPCSTQPVHHFAALVFVPGNAPVRHPLAAEHAVTDEVHSALETVHLRDDGAENHIVT